MTGKVPNCAGASRRPPGGSRKGCPNKITKALREMVLAALDQAGGEAYLVEQARKNPTAFLALLGKVLPTSLSVGSPGGDPLQVTVRVVKAQKAGTGAA